MHALQIVLVCFGTHKKGAGRSIVPTEEIVTRSNGRLLKFSLRVGYGSFFIFRCTLDTDKFDISIILYRVNSREGCF
jgi:hypothetical protein